MSAPTWLYSNSLFKHTTTLSYSPCCVYLIPDMLQASALNSDLGGWDVARVVTTNGMFAGNKAFVGTGVEKVREKNLESNVWQLMAGLPRISNTFSTSFRHHTRHPTCTHGVNSLSLLSPPSTLPHPRIMFSVEYRSTHQHEGHVQIIRSLQRRHLFVQHRKGEEYEPRFE